MPSLSKDPTADLEELFDFGYLNQDEYEEAKAKRARAQDLGGATAALMHVEIAQLDGAGSCSEAEAPLTDTETVVTATGGGSASTETETFLAASETGTSPTDSAGPENNKSDEAGMQHPLENDSKTTDE